MPGLMRVGDDVTLAVKSGTAWWKDNQYSMAET